MRSHAIILGGSLAGHCCARALSRFFETITLIERDEIPSGASFRAGVPQGRHAHVILDRGRRELERFFPGFEQRMVEKGASVIDPGLVFAAFGGNGWSPRVPTSARNVCASRDLTDATVRELAASLPNVVVRQRTEVTDLRRTGRRITGVTVRSRDGGATEELTADLVVDASGRSSKVPAMLQRVGVAVPEETVIDSGTWYSTRWFTSEPDHALPDSCWWKAAILVPMVKSPVGALLTPVEGDRWIVSVATIGRGQPQIDEKNFLETLRGLPSPIIAEAVGEPASPVYGSRSTPNRMLHYDRLIDPVAGFVAVGDAVCALNPIQGQGVSVTAVCAHVLETAVEAEGPESSTLPERFFKAQARWLAEPWGLATSFDLRFPATAGKRSLAGKIVAPYMKLFVGALRDDVSLLRHISEIGQLNLPSATLMSPSIVARVLKATVRRRLGRTTAPAEPVTGAYPPPTIVAA